MKIINTSTLQVLSVGQQVKTAAGQGIIVEIRDNCAYPIFININGVIDAYKWSEVTA